MSSPAISFRSLASKDLPSEYSKSVRVGVRTQSENPEHTI